MNKKFIYLDDIRTPNDSRWTVVRDYYEFIDKVTEIGLENIELISLDHDLGDTAMMEWHTNVRTNFTLDYNNISEKTGMDCAKWLIQQWMDGEPLCEVKVHSVNAIGASNIMGYINNYRHTNYLPQTCIRWQVPHTIETIIEE